MPTKTPPAPWQQLEEQAYNACREWPIWLVLRIRELDSRRGAGRALKRAPGAAIGAPAVKRGSPAIEKKS